MGTFRQSMFHRIVVDVIEMPGIIPFIAKCMFPKAWLPNAAPAMADAGRRKRFFRTAERQPGLSVMFFLISKILQLGEANMPGVAR